MTSALRLLGKDDASSYKLAPQYAPQEEQRSGNAPDRFGSYEGRRYINYDQGQRSWNGQGQLGQGFNGHRQDANVRSGLPEPNGVVAERKEAALPQPAPTGPKSSLLTLGSSSTKPSLRATYTLLYRKAFIARVRRMHFLLAVTSLCLAMASLISFKNDSITNVSYILGYSSSLWTFAIYIYAGALPVYVMKKTRLTVRKKRAHSQFDRLQGLLAPGNLIVVAAFTSSALVIARGYMSNRGGGPLFFNFVIPGSRHPQINERPIFICLSVFAHATMVAIQYILNEEDTIAFPVQEHLSMGRRLAKRLGARTTNVVSMALSHSAIFWLMYRIFRKTVYSALRSTPFKKWFALAVRKNQITSTVFAHSLALNILLSLNWQVVFTLIEVYCTQLIETISSSPTPIESLLDGISLDQKSVPHIKIMAFGELLDVAIHGQRLRVEIFEAISTTPTGFRKVSTECLKVIGAGFVRLAEIGRQDGATAESATARKAGQTVPDPKAHRVTEPKSEVNVFVQGPAKRGFLESFLVLGSVQAPAAASKAIAAVPEPSYVRETRTKMLKLLGADSAVEKTRATTNDIATASSSSSTATQVKVAQVNMTHRLLPQWLSSSILSPDVGLQAALAFEDGYLQILAIRALSYLTAASYLEDTYGTAQQDLAKILEAFCAYLLAIEQYESKHSSVSAKAQLDVWSGCIKRELELGLIRILMAFNKHIKAFPLSRPHAQRLRELAQAHGL